MSLIEFFIYCMSYFSLYGKIFFENNRSNESGYLHCYLKTLRVNALNFWRR